MKKRGVANAGNREYRDKRDPEKVATGSFQHVYEHNLSNVTFQYKRHISSLVFKILLSCNYFETKKSLNENQRFTSQEITAVGLGIFTPALEVGGRFN